MVRAARNSRRGFFGNQPRAYGHVVMAWLAITVALVAVLMVTAIDTLTGRWFSAADANTPDPASAILIESQPVATTTYGSVEWRLMESRLVPRADNTPFSRPVVIVEMVAVNHSDDTVARARRRDVSLLLWDGRRVEMNRFENTPSTNLVEIEPGHAEAMTLVYKPVLPYNPNLDLLSIEIREPNRYPSILHLDGSPGSDLYPRQLAVANNAESVVDGITVSKAELDVDYGPYRSTVDQRLLVVTAVVDQKQLERQAGAIGGPPSVQSAKTRWDEADFWSVNFQRPSAEDAEADADGAEAEGESGPANVTVSASRLTVLSDVRDDAAGVRGSGQATVQLVFVVPVEATSDALIISLGDGAGPVAATAANQADLRRMTPRWRW